MTLLTLLQSCIINKSSSVKEASQYENRRIKIKTVNNEKYILKWIEQQNDNVVSIKKMRRTFIDKKDIDKIMILQPTHLIVPLDSALNHAGTILVRTIVNKDAHPYVLDTYEHSFIKIVDEGEYIKGYKMTGKDTVTVVIPISQIKRIKEVDKTGSIVISSLSAFILTMAGLGIYGMSQWSWDGI